MGPIKINVNVQIGVTEELSGLLANLFTPKHSAPAVAAAPAVENAPADAPAPEAAPAEQAPVEQPAQEAAPAPAPASQEVKEYTEVDVRAAMGKARRRIEGEDYKDNTGSENYKKYHRQLTQQFKNIAALLGSDKPSALPTSELRAQFIQACDELVIENGEITTKVPF